MSMAAERLDLEERFDAAFSNAALHWVRDLEGAVAGIARHLEPGGRFVGEFGGHGCVAAVCTALQAVGLAHSVRLRLPWYFPTPDDFTSRIVDAGFRPVSVQLIPRPTPLPAGMTAWLRTFGGPMLDQLPASLREQALSQTVDLLQWSLCDEKGHWTADYVRLRFAALVA